MPIINLIYNNGIKTLPNYLCFTANTAGSTVKLVTFGSPASVSLETSTDGLNRNNYVIGNTITLSSVGYKIYFRNKSETTTNFATSDNNIYRFQTSGSVSGSGDITTLINKNGTDTISSYCFCNLFGYNSALATAPELPAINIASYCYKNMFIGSGISKAPSLPATVLYNNCYEAMFASCTNLVSLPKLPANILPNSCYYTMFSGCSKIKLSGSQSTDYMIAYKIPSEGTISSEGSYSLYSMFYGTGGSWTGTPSINTTYYTSNTVV